ncbi:VRR-NUC domain-containing protein [Nitrosophilus kaiyonis]|uniref:VRR-NUC domain-containing protein n=1 Tax=Nitrosophilus kaiyonis TaxID=2930200 RepID=UPI0024903350|nr:VRR-NUC domain-containing protein [Nitrosophilus kaiyonis]
MNKILGRIKKSYKSSEHDEQSKVVEFCRWNKIPIFAIPNGAWIPIKNHAMRSKYINKLKREGMSPGVPDLCIPVPNGQYHGLFIEMKVKGGFLRDEQKRWIKELNKQGYKAVVCYSGDEAIKAIREYTDG